MKILEKVSQLITARDLCNHCLGRQFGNLLSGMSNDQRGETLRFLVHQTQTMKKVKEYLLSDTKQERDKDFMKTAATPTLCERLEREIGSETWTTFIGKFILYVAMIAEVSLRRESSPEAFNLLTQLAKQGHVQAQETLKKSTIKMALEKTPIQPRQMNGDLSVTNDAASCSHCLDLLENQKFRSFIASRMEVAIAIDNTVMTEREGDHESDTCELCQGFFHETSLNQWCQRVEETCQNIEFYTFVVGSIIPPEMMEKEDEIQATYGLSEWGEILKSEINREVGKKLLQRWENLQRTVDVTTQDLVILINLIKNQVELNIHPVFIEGRYCKYVRNIPQSHWPCKDCRGNGCPLCNFTGKKYPISVAELIINPSLPLFEGEDGKFHGAGREDIDARMLGKGRPFVLEIIKPKKRRVPLELLEKTINDNSQGKISVKLLRYTARMRLRQLKGLSSKTSKKYLATVEIHGKSVDDVLSMKSELEAFFNNLEIEQWTPRRVLHRRANKIRRRTVHSLNLLGRDSEKESCINIEITCDGGLYVKELISGDDGRTQPNFSQMIKAPAKVVALDVLEVLIDQVDDENDD